jgi:uncharacterized membrane protein HdeD (DUF308 family)
MPQPDQISVAAGDSKRDSRMMILMGVLMVFIGLLAMAAPLATGIAVAITVGCLVVLGGILQVILGVKAESWGSRIFGIMLGVVALVCGILLIGHPLFSLGYLSLLLAGYFFIDGIFQLVQAWDIKPEQGWASTLFAGLFSMLLGVLIWRQWPVSGAWAVGILVGIKIVLSGWSMIACGRVGRQESAAMSEP